MINNLNAIQLQGNIPGIFHENVFPPKDLDDDTERENSSCISESEYFNTIEHSFTRLDSSDDIVNKASIRRKKSSHSKGCCSFSNSKDVQSDSSKEDKTERRKHEKANSSPFIKSRNNMRVMLSKFIANNNRGKHERDT